jgi:hypothetical protein
MLPYCETPCHLCLPPSCELFAHMPASREAPSRHHLPSIGAELDAEVEACVVDHGGDDTCDNPPREIPYYRLKPIHFGH